VSSLAGSHPYSMILSRLVDSMGSAIWLTELELHSSEDAAYSQMKLVGFTGSNEILGDFLDRLAAEPLFETVILKYAGTGQQSGSRLKGTHANRIQFEIECDVSRG
jgi:hypothetical protein